MSSKSSVSTFGVGSVRLNSPVRDIERVNASFNDLLATVKKYAKPRPSDYDWKEDYAQALEEKYVNIR